MKNCDVDFQRAFTNMYDIMYHSPGQGGVCLAGGNPATLLWYEKSMLAGG